jgi:hypothetical protein
MATTLLTAGLACLIAAIVGGGLKAWGIEIPALQSLKRQVLLASLGIALALIGGLMLRGPAPPGNSVTTQPNQVPSQKDIQESNPPADKKETKEGASGTQRNIAARSNAEPKYASAPANGMRVVDQSGNAIVGADILLIASDGRHWEQFSNQDGTVYFVPPPPGPVGVFCAGEGYAGYYQPVFDPTLPLLISLVRAPSGGSKVIVAGAGYLPGLEGRINPILDNLNRTYLYAENIAIDGGKTQPVDFTINHSFQAVDSHGSRLELTVVKIIGSSSLINYRKE